MAKLYIEQAHQWPTDWDEINPRVDIVFQPESPSSKVLLKRFKNDDNVNLVEQEMSLGGGGGYLIESLLQTIQVSVAISLYLVSTSYFKEIGKGLAQRTLDVVFGHRLPSLVAIYNKKKKTGANIFIPTGMKKAEIKVLAKKIEKFSTKKNAGGVYFYDRKKMKIIKIDIYDSGTFEITD